MTARKPPEKPVVPPPTKSVAPESVAPESAGQPVGDPGWFPVTNETFERRMTRIERVLRNIGEHLSLVEQRVTQIGEVTVSTQDDVTAIANELTQEESDLNQAVASIQDWINSQPASVDVSELQTLADGLKTSVSNAAALVPAPPAPPAGG